MLEYTTKILVLLLVPVTFGFVFLGRPFIELWMGPGYGLSADILTVLALSQLFSLPQQGLRAILYGIGEHRFLAYTTALEGAMNLLLSVILVSRYGPLGVAWAAAIPAVLVGMLCLPRIGCRLLKMPLGPHLAGAYGRPLATSVAFVGCMLVTTSLMPPTSWGFLILDAAICSLGHLVVSGVFVLGAEDRQTVWRLARQAAGRLPGSQPADLAKSVPAAPEGLR
jgi:O-antigen/teichoic acid export membrane protein